jgi:N-acetylglucosaminyldiphosphoundecaprenol N-acetyl-beta-D-mannosaminyltransferase
MDGVRTVDILGFPVADVDMGEAVAAAVALLERRGRAQQAAGADATNGGTAREAATASAAIAAGAATGAIATAASAPAPAPVAAPAARIVTANAEILCHGSRDAALGELLRGADLIVPDGIGVVKAAAMLGQPVKARVAGIDLLAELAAWAAAHGRSVYLLGAAKESVEGAAAALLAKHPTLKIAGWHDGYFNEGEAEQIILDIQASKPDFLFVAMGFPAQDRFFEKHKARLPVGVMMGVGGAFDALSGRVKRAPLWIQRLNLEWAYRFAQNPRRLRRIWALPQFMLAVRRQRRQCQKNHK